VDVTWFEATLEDEIVTVFTPSFESRPVNQAGESERHGVEISGTAQLAAGWTLDGSYTYLDADDPDGRTEVRRPRHSGSANVNYAFFGGRGNANVGVVFNGDQEDSEFIPTTPETRVTLDEFVLLNLAVSFAVNDRVQLFVRGENLLDEDYTQVFGFDSPGIAGYLGVRARL
jgi:vitamin B12 transporter